MTSYYVQAQFHKHFLKSKHNGSHIPLAAGKTEAQRGKSLATVHTAGEQYNPDSNPDRSDPQTLPLTMLIPYRGGQSCWRPETWSAVDQAAAGLGP